MVVRREGGTPTTPPWWEARLDAILRRFTGILKACTIPPYLLISPEFSEIAISDISRFVFFSVFFFSAHRTNDLTKKLEKVGPFECDEPEKHCRVNELLFQTVKKEKYGQWEEILNIIIGKTSSICSMGRNP